MARGRACHGGMVNVLVSPTRSLPRPTSPTGDKDATSVSLPIPRNVVQSARLVQLALHMFDRRMV